MAVDTHEHNGKTLGGLFADLSRAMSNMFRQEVELAKTEMTMKAKQGVKDAVFIIAGGFLVFAGFLLLLFAAVAALSQILPVWLAALIVGIVVCGVAYSLIQKGLSDLKRAKFKPEQTIASLKESGKWAREQI